VELRARNKRTDAGVPPSAMPIAEGASQADKDSAWHSITVRYDTLLYDTLQNMILSSHTAQDFTYTSIADFIRAALRAYKDGMVLTELDRNGPKTETSIRVDQDLWLFYKSLPRRMRTKILERAIRTFMKQQFVPEHD
jgi:uncharacterized protein (DUF4415 family)